MSSRPCNNNNNINHLASGLCIILRLSSCCEPHMHGSHCCCCTLLLLHIPQVMMTTKCHHSSSKISAFSSRLVLLSIPSVAPNSSPSPLEPTGTTAPGQTALSCGPHSTSLSARVIGVCTRYSPYAQLAMRRQATCYIPRESVSWYTFNNNPSGVGGLGTYSGCGILPPPLFRQATRALLQLDLQSATAAAAWACYR